MAPTTGSTEAEREIATIRCLLAQQLHTIDAHACGAPERRAADLLVRQLLRREEDLRSVWIDTIAVRRAV